MTKKTAGTHEWAYKNLNTEGGCEHDCSYCYAKRMAKKYGRIKKDEDWKCMIPNYKNINKNYRKINNPTDLYDYMYPTSHDITPKSVDNYIIVLKKILKAGNTVLITTKANFDCIDKIYDKVLSNEDKSPNKYINQIEFRITIGSINNEILKKYEPGAPPLYYSRLTTLCLLTSLGFKTSVSIEPFLDRNPIPLIQFLSEHTNGTIWLGLMSGSVPSELKSNYTEENLFKIVSDIRYLPENIRSKIRFKDSIRNKLNL